MAIGKQPDLPQGTAEQVQIIEQLLEIGVALSGSYKLGELLNLILSKSREITCSDAGSVYLVDRDDEFPRLLFKAAQNASRPFVSFREFAIPLTPKSLAGYVALTGESLNIPDAYELSSDVPYQLNRNFDRDIGYRTRTVLVLPMRNRQGDIIGVLQLINRKKRSDILIKPENVLEVTQPYTEWEERLVRSLASQAGTSIERNHLQENVEILFEGFVKASVQAIESRDPCTSGHSERVALLTVRLSEEVNAIADGPLKPTFFSPRQLQEIRYASLLHDFGKVGVPEAILTKRNKLYPDQLEVLRHRFNFARRTLEFECARDKYRYLTDHPDAIAKHSDSDCPHCQQLSELDDRLTRSIERLDRDWKRLLKLNEPHTPQDDLAWILEDLSRLAYRDIDGEIKPLLSEQELRQLSVVRGNLTAKERSAMEAHVSHSFEFLKRIPWTKYLEKVPEIAYAHHEKLDGSGYPRGLKKDDIPIQTQIMTIADIYDALTAGDRPYKRGLPVATAIEILHEEAAHFKINADLVQVFEQRQVFSVLGHVLETLPVRIS